MPVDRDARIQPHIQPRMPQSPEYIQMLAMLVYCSFLLDIPMFESTGVLKPKRLLPVLVVTSVLLVFAITSSSLGDSEFNECMAHSLSAASPFAAAVHDPAQNIDVAKFNTSRSLNGAASQSFKGACLNLPLG